MFGLEETALDASFVNDQNQSDSFIYLIHRFLSNGGVGSLGALFMVIGTIGWIANPIYFGYQEGLDDEESIAIGILPAYTTAVLCAFYGAGIFNKIYGYMTSWPEDKRNKFSLEARLYPKIFFLFLLFNINFYIELLSSGPSFNQEGYTARTLPSASPER